MGLILDLLDSGTTALWSITTEADAFDFYVLPDYIAKPIDWSIDWGRPWRDDRTTETVPSFLSAHPNESREATGAYTSDVGDQEFTITEIVSRSLGDLDTIPLEITGTATLVTTGFHAFTDLLFTLVPVGYEQAFAHTVVIDWGDETTTTHTPTPVDYDTFTAGEHTPYTYAHAYDAPGTYTLSFTITAPVRETGSTDTLYLFCVIHPVPIPFTYGMTVDWGDGDQDTYADTTDGRGSGDSGDLAVTHAYDTPGPHTATITATQGRWVPSFPFGAGDISALGPMKCGFRLGCDLYQTFREAGVNVHDGCLFSPELHFENAVFMSAAFDSAKIRANSDNFPFAADFPAYSFASLRWGTGIFFNNITYLPLASIQSFHRPFIFQAKQYEYQQCFSADDVFAVGFQAYYFNAAPDGVSDALHQYLQAQNYPNGELDIYDKFTTLAGYQAALALEADNWILDFTEVWLGFFLKPLSSGYSGSRAYLLPQFSRGLWFEPISGGLRVKFTIYRQALLAPSNPAPATVSWQLERRRGTEVLSGSGFHGFTYSFSIIASNTESFTASETSKLVTVDLLEPYYAFRSYESPTFDAFTLSLTAATSESLSNGAQSLSLSGQPEASPAGLTNPDNQKGFSAIRQSLATTPTGLRFRVTIGRYPSLNPGNPGAASIDWRLERADLSAQQLWAGVTWSIVDSDTVNFTATEQEKTIDILYDDPYTATPAPPYATPWTHFRVTLLNPVNETLGYSNFDTFVYY